MGYALKISTVAEFETLECGHCGIVFAITGNWLTEHREQKKEFWCPNGHHRIFLGETEAERLRRELADKERALSWERDRTASLSKQLGNAQKTTAKLKRRIARGICPCCQRTVSQLARHMETKHPEFVKASDGKVGAR